MIQPNVSHKQRVCALCHSSVEDATHGRLLPYARSRTTSAAAEPCKPGDAVEVAFPQGEEHPSVWLEGTLVEPRLGDYAIKYASFVNDDQSELVEPCSLDDVRPQQPPGLELPSKLERGDPVDVRHDECWWEGVFMKYVSRKYASRVTIRVWFPGASRGNWEENVRLDECRPGLDWKDGRWQRRVQPFVHEVCAKWAGIQRLHGRFQGATSVISAARAHVCSKCNRPGASIPCCSTDCSRDYHFPCAVDAGAIGTKQRHYPRPIACGMHVEFNTYKHVGMKLASERKEFPYGEVPRKLVKRPFASAPTARPAVADLEAAAALLQAHTDHSTLDSDSSQPAPKRMRQDASPDSIRISGDGDVSDDGHAGSASGSRHEGRDNSNEAAAHLPKAHLPGNASSVAQLEVEHVRGEAAGAVPMLLSSSSNATRQRGLPLIDLNADGEGLLMPCRDLSPEERTAQLEKALADAVVKAERFERMFSLEKRRHAQTRADLEGMQAQLETALKQSILVRAECDQKVMHVAAQARLARQALDEFVQLHS
eukprot:jgi/Chlat1/2735/Chrsp182S02892